MNRTVMLFGMILGLVWQADCALGQKTWSLNLVNKETYERLFVSIEVPDSMKEGEEYEHTFSYELTLASGKVQTGNSSSTLPAGKNGIPDTKQVVHYINGLSQFGAVHIGWFTRFGAWVQKLKTD